MPVQRETGAGDRALFWDGCLNVRELGGLPTEDRGPTRFKAVLRADSIRKLTDAGWESLLDYGVVCIVDLRFHSELAEDPPRDLPIEVVHVSVLPELDSDHWPELDALEDAAPDQIVARREVYLEFLERFRQRFAEAVRAIAEAPEGTVVVHCLGGKDRTGLVSALVLRVAGVSIAEVAADYALSEANLRDEASEWVAQAATEEERRIRERRTQTPAEAMVGVLEGLERRYGSVEGYLLAGGASEQTLEQIRARLTG